MAYHEVMATLMEERPRVKSDLVSLRLDDLEADQRTQFLCLVPSWLLSLILHVALLLALACLSFSNPGNLIPVELSVRVKGDDEHDRLAMLSTVVVDGDVPVPKVDYRDLQVPEPVEFIKETIRPQITMDDVMHAMDEGPKFFGSTGQGERFVFVIDRSSSMTGKKFAEARKELLTALRQLQPYQQFYIIFFDRGILEMFGRSDGGEMISASKANLKRTERWIRQVDVGRGTMPYQALRRAFELCPDTIFLLSDGRFNSGDRTVAWLLRGDETAGEELSADQRRIRINTVGFYHKDDGTLTELAEKFSGTYRLIEEE